MTALPSKKIICLASGSGSIFASLLTHIQTLKLPIQVMGLFTDIEDCGAAQVAKDHHIQVYAYPNWNKHTRDEHCDAMHKQFQKLNPDLIFSLGFMRILSEALVKHWQEKLFNTHPSLLPAFRGHRAVRDAIQAGCKTVGTSVHQMISDVDAGPILAQSGIYRFSAESEDDLHEKIKTIEKAQVMDTLMHKLYG